MRCPGSEQQEGADIKKARMNPAHIGSHDYTWAVSSRVGDIL